MRKPSLKRQLLFSHTTLVTLMFVLMIGAVVDFFRLSHSIDRILKDNYASVVVVQRMKDNLAALDSQAALSLSGARGPLTMGIKEVQAFERAYQSEAHNITEPGEQDLVN